MSRELEERLAALEAAVERGLDLLAEGRAEEARVELLRVVGPETPALDEPLDAGELERAFDEAQPEVDEMIDATRVAQHAMRQADESLGDAIPPSELGTPFATETMADLLERQGDFDGADRIRANLANGGSSQGAQAPPPGSGGDRVVSTLEHWLGNLRRPRA